MVILFLQNVGIYTLHKVTITIFLVIEQANLVSVTVKRMLMHSRIIY